LQSQRGLPKKRGMEETRKIVKEKCIRQPKNARLKEVGTLAKGRERITAFDIPLTSESLQGYQSELVDCG